MAYIYERRTTRLATHKRIQQITAAHEGTVNRKNIEAVVAYPTQQKVDAEIKSILDQQYLIARKLIEKNKKKIEAMAKALLEYETIDSDQINDIMAGKKVRPPKPSRGTSPPKGNKSGGSGIGPTLIPQPAAKK